MQNICSSEPNLVGTTSNIAGFESPLGRAHKVHIEGEDKERRSRGADTTRFPISRDKSLNFLKLEKEYSCFEGTFESGFFCFHGIICTSLLLKAKFS